MSTGKISAEMRQPWWTVPENFLNPMAFYVDEEVEERIFGSSDADLRRLEEQTNTLIQLERGFTASGQTRVTVVGPRRGRWWLRSWVLGSPHRELEMRGIQMLQQVMFQPPTIPVPVSPICTIL